MCAASSASLPVTPAPSAAASDTLEHPLLPYAVDVLAHLERDAERLVEVVAVEREQRARPVDRLAHAGQLVELLRTQPGHRGAHALRDLIRHVGQPGVHDLLLAFGP